MTTGILLDLLANYFRDLLILIISLRKSVDSHETDGKSEDTTFKDAVAELKEILSNSQYLSAQRGS